MSGTIRVVATSSTQRSMHRAEGVVLAADEKTQEVFQKTRDRSQGIAEEFSTGREKFLDGMTSKSENLIKKMTEFQKVEDAMFVEMMERLSNIDNILLEQQKKTRLQSDFPY